MIIRIIACIFSLVALLGFWRLFQKFGRKGWEGIIPVYKTYVLGQLTKDKKRGLCVGLAELIILILGPFAKNSTIFSLLILIVACAYLYFGIPFYKNVCSKMHIDKYWTIAWILCPGLVAIVFGLGKEFDWLTYDEDLNFEEVKKTFNSTVKDATKTFNKMVDEAQKETEEKKAETKEKVDSAISEVKEAVKSDVEETKADIAEVSEKVDKKVEEVKDAVKSDVEETKEDIKEIKEKVDQKVEEVKKEVKEDSSEK